MPSPRLHRLARALQSLFDLHMPVVLNGSRPRCLECQKLYPCPSARTAAEGLNIRKTKVSFGPADNYQCNYKREPNRAWRRIKE